MNEEKSSENLTLPEAWRSKPALLVAFGAVSFLVSLGMCLASGAGTQLGLKYFFHSFLTNFIYCLSFGLGALFFVLIQFLTRAGWSASIRRLAEIIATTIPYMAILFLPILYMVTQTQNTSLYEWNGPNVSAIVAGKAAFLNGPFFVVRAIIYFSIWSLAALWYFNNSRKQDVTGSVDVTLLLQKWSGPFVMLFALSVSFAAFDWVMSIDPEWFSTVFGVYLFAASMMGFFAMMIVMSVALQRSGKLVKEIRVDNYHDMGKFMFGFIMFWSYIAFCQMMLYWYGNIPEETVWFKVRLADGWQYLSYGLIPLHFAIPFLGVMSRHVRRHRAGLCFWAVWVLIAHWLDMTFLVMPNAGPVIPMALAGHVVCGVGMLAFFFACFLYRASDSPLVAIRDPRLHEAMTYTNPIL